MRILLTEALSRSFELLWTACFVFKFIVIERHHKSYTMVVSDYTDLYM